MGDDISAESVSLDVAAGEVGALAGGFVSRVVGLAPLDRIGRPSSRDRRRMCRFDLEILPFGLVCAGTVSRDKSRE